MIKIISTVTQWIIVAVLVYFLATAVPRWPKLFTTLNLPKITGLLCVAFSVSFAFWWVYVLKWFKRIKPFNCLKCMSGWVCLLTAILFQVSTPYLYIFIGVFAGALFDHYLNR